MANMLHGQCLGFSLGRQRCLQLLGASHHRTHLQVRHICHCSGKRQQAGLQQLSTEQDRHPSRQANNKPEQQDCVSVGMDVECYVHKDRQNDPEKGYIALNNKDKQTDEQSTQDTGTVWATILNAAILISPFAFWGTSMVVMKGLPLPPLVMGAIRLVPAGALLVAWALIQNRPMPSTAKAWAWIAVFALVDGAAFQGFLAEGLQRTSAGLGSVIIDSQPLTVAVLASILFGEQLGVVGIAGLLLGVAGLLLLELPEQYLLVAADGLLTTASNTPATAQLAGQIQAALPEGVSAAMSEAAALPLPPPMPMPAGSAGAGMPAIGASWPASLTIEDLIRMSAPSSWIASGEFWMLAAAQAMAVGTVMVRYVTKHADPIMATGWHMVLGGLVLVVASLIQDPAAIPQSASELTQPNNIASAAYISLLGGAASYGIFFWQASTQGNLTKLSSLTFLTPVFAAVTGYFVLGEVLTLPQALGAVITLSSVFLITSSKPSEDSKGKEVS